MASIDATSERTRVSSTSACSVARINANAFSRSAAACSRIVRTFSSASAPEAVAAIASASACASSTRLADIFTAFSVSANAVANSAANAFSRSSLSLFISFRRTSRSRAIRAASRRCSDVACSSAVSAIERERAISISRCCVIVASSSSRLIVSFLLVASSWLWRTATSASDSIIALSFLLTAIISAKRRIPSALNALFSSKA